MKTKKERKYEFPHEEGNLVCSYPSFSGYLEDVANEIDNAGLRMPTSSETVSLIYDALRNPGKKYSSRIIKILDNKWFWEFTRKNYLPKGKGDFQNGVFIQDNPLIVNGKLTTNTNDLIKKMEDAKEFRIKGHPILVSSDRTTRYTPFGFKTGEQTIKELVENPRVVAEYFGREGNELENSEKLGVVASRYDFVPYLGGFDSVDEEIIKMSALSGHWYFDYRLGVHDDSFGDGIGKGHAFGIHKDIQKLE